MRFLLLISLCLLCGSLVAQEICDNGQDDDGDGLIDLQDPDCDCLGFGEGTFENLVSNPSFADFDCCPDNFTQLYCSDNWESLSTTTPDLHHTCDYQGESGLEAAILPAPDGNGAAGIIISPIWKEYIKTCLDDPLQPGESYFFQVDIASSPVNEFNQTCAGGELFYENLDLTLYGSDQCAEFPQVGVDCPLSNGPGWEALGSIQYTPAANWGTLSFEFTVAQSIQSLAIGGPCVLPDSYESIEPFCYPYFYLDNVVIAVSNNENASISLSSSGTLCDGNAQLFASATVAGGSWQWYLDGIALVGETNALLPLSELGYPGGLYTAVYSLGDDCEAADIEVESSDSFSSSIDVELCEGDSFILPDGTVVNESGSFSINYETINGCDSLLNFDIQVFETFLDLNDFILCAGQTLELANGQTINETGTYTVQIDGEGGCDTLLIYNVQVLSPSTSTEERFLCPGESIELPSGQIISEAGTFTSVYPSENGCDSIVTVTVTPLPEPSAFFTYTSSGFYPDISLTFNNLSTNAESYVWEILNVETSDFEPDYTLFTGSSQGEICLTATNSDGCSDRVCTSVSFLEEFTFYCPNAFTPDEDGLNDGFGPVVRGHDPDDYSFEIWNRWGERIFYSENVEKRWIGNNDGDRYYVGNGLYVWQCVVKALGGTEKIRFRGHVLLIR